MQVLEIEWQGIFILLECSGQLAEKDPGLEESDMVCDL